MLCCTIGDNIKHVFFKKKSKEIRFFYDSSLLEVISNGKMEKRRQNVHLNLDTLTLSRGWVDGGTFFGKTW